jgi:hypothetical protein
MKLLLLLAAFALSTSSALNFTNAGPGAPPIFADWMVMQQAPAKAAIYGFLNASDTVKTVSVAVSGGGTARRYTVTATLLGDKWKAFLHPTHAGGDYTIIVTAGSAKLEIKHVTFGDVYYCSGQSNMAVHVAATLGRNNSIAAIKSGKYSQLYIHGLRGNMNSAQPWQNVSAAVATPNKNVNNGNSNNHDGNNLLDFSSTCYYFGESLIDLLGDNAPPIGLVHTAWGGSMIEQWLSNETIATCGNVSKMSTNSAFHEQYVMPYAEMSLKGFVWYQGENDMNTFFGNSQVIDPNFPGTSGTGYSCLMPKLVEEWRRLWSTTPGTTDPLAPFGLVTLPNTGSEGGSDIGSMRHAQTAGYGTMPNEAMPNTFLAQGYDLSDPFRNDSCYFDGCWPQNMSHGNAGCFRGQNASVDVCGWKNATTAKKCAGCEGYIHSVAFNNWVMGPIHGRAKKPVGMRLAQALSVLSYGGAGPVSGPTLSGCKKTGDTITISFNKTAMAGGKMIVQPYDRGGGGKLPAVTNSKMHVLVNSSLLCFQSGRDGRAHDICMDDGSGVFKGGGGYPPRSGFHDSNSFPTDLEWVSVDIAAGAADNEIVVDLSKSKGVAFAIRYAWSGDCCTDAEASVPSSAPCPLESCPLMATTGAVPTGWLSHLPPNPFFARITANGKCECLHPQVCDA